MERYAVMRRHSWRAPAEGDAAAADLLADEVLPVARTVVVREDSVAATAEAAGP
jgi:hypothetical protein